MDRMIYVAMAGAKQTMLAQAVNANNLANVNTVGFRQDLQGFMSVTPPGPGFPSRTYAVDQHNGVDLSSGALVNTGRELDVAVSGEGWIAVQARDGQEAYTRAGNLRITTNGTLVTASGLPVLGNAGSPIAIPPQEKVEIGSDGTISIRPVGQSVQALTTVDRIKLVNPPAADLVKGDDGLMRLSDGRLASADAGVQLMSGTLEMSNVNAVNAMVDMIALSRQYEMEVKLMRTAKENDQSSAQLIRIA